MTLYSFDNTVRVVTYYDNNGKRITRNTSIKEILDNIGLYKYILIKIRLTYITYKYVGGEIFITNRDITSCSDYEKYRKTYKLLYGV